MLDCSSLVFETVENLPKMGQDNHDVLACLYFLETGGYLALSDI